MSTVMIEKLERIAEHDKMPIGLVFGDSQGHLTIHGFNEESNRRDDDDDASNDDYSQPDDTVESKLTHIIDKGQAVAKLMDTPINALELDQVTQETNLDASVASEDESQAESEEEPRTTHVTVKEEPEEEAKPTRARLCKRVTQTHNKYGDEEGFTPSHHSRFFFTAGYTKAAKKLNADNEAIMLVATAIENYNNLDASQTSISHGSKEDDKAERGSQGEGQIMCRCKKTAQVHIKKMQRPQWCHCMHLCYHVQVLEYQTGQTH
eukprot:jgi/Psemu1/18793/gm1.18793_g